MKTFDFILVVTICTLITALLSACAFSVNPDGSKSGSISGKDAAKVIKAIGNK